jgi:hypothetical protein
MQISQRVKLLKPLRMAVTLRMSMALSTFPKAFENVNLYGLVVKLVNAYFRPFSFTNYPHVLRI